MNVIIDIVIVAIFALTVIIAAKNGFVKTAISAASFILAIIITSTFTAPLSAYLNDAFVGDTVESVVTDELEAAIVQGSLKLEQVLDGQSEDFNKFISMTGLDLDAIGSWFDENVADTDNAQSALAHRIADPIAETASNVLAVVILFIGTQVVLSIAAVVLNGIAKLPVLRSCNKLLGIILGVVLAFLRVFLFCFVMKMLIENADFLGIDFLVGVDPAKSLLFDWFYNLEIFNFLV